MDEFELELYKSMNLIGFKFEKDLEACDKMFVSKSNPKHIIVNDFISHRLGFYFENEFKEQFFFYGSKYDERTFIEWLKNPIPKSRIELTAIRVKEYIDKNYKI